jgi:hypothetical protein
MSLFVWHQFVGVMDCGRADIEFDLVVFNLLVEPSYNVKLLDAGRR